MALDLFLSWPSHWLLVLGERVTLPSYPHPTSSRHWRECRPVISHYRGFSSSSRVAFSTRVTSTVNWKPPSRFDTITLVNKAGHLTHSISSSVRPELHIYDSRWLCGRLSHSRHTCALPCVCKNFVHCLAPVTSTGFTSLHCLNASINFGKSHSCHPTWPRTRSALIPFSLFKAALTLPVTSCNLPMVSKLWALCTSVL